MFKIDSTLLPSWVQQTKNNTIAELGLPLSLTKYPKIPADRYEGPVDDYNRFVATEDNYPWLMPIPGFTNAEGKQLAFRSCCDFISTSTTGKEWHATTETITDEIISDKKGKLTLASGVVVRTNATMIMLALTGSGGGGAGGAMANSGPGGGGAATAVFVADTTKFTKIKFTLPMGGQGGPAGIANSNWNGVSGDSGRIEFWDGDSYMFTLVVDGGRHGIHLIDTSRIPGSGGQQCRVENSEGTTFTFTSDDFTSNHRYSSINSWGVVKTNMVQEDTVVYMLRVVAGATGGEQGSNAQIFNPANYPATFCTDGVYISPTSPPTLPTSASRMGGDGGNSLIGQGGLASYNEGLNYSDPVAGKKGGGGGGARFHITQGCAGGAGGGACLQLLSLYSTVSSIETIRQAGIIKKGSVLCVYKKYDDITTNGYESLNFNAGSYIPRNDGVIVPTLYSNSDKRKIDYETPYCYIGDETYNGVQYNVWQKKEGSAFVGIYMYTNKIVQTTNGVHFFKSGIFASDPLEEMENSLTGTISYNLTHCELKLPPESLPAGNMLQINLEADLGYHFVNGLSYIEAEGCTISDIQVYKKNSLSLYNDMLTFYINEPIDEEITIAVKAIINNGGSIGPIIPDLAG